MLTFQSGYAHTRFPEKREQKAKSQQNAKRQQKTKNRKRCRHCSVLRTLYRKRGISTT